MKKLLIFDMDGTIADTSSGIYASYRHVAKELGIPEPTTDKLSYVIGGSLPNNLQMVYGLNSDQVEEAVKIYRDYYSSKGIMMSFLYDDFEYTARELKKRGYALSVATMKAEVFANELIHQWHLDDVFSNIYGVNANDSIEKSEMIRKCMINTGLSAGETYMIGDSPQDRQAAIDAGVNFIAVTYGFHYTETECIELRLKYVNSVCGL